MLLKKERKGKSESEKKSRELPYESFLGANSVGLLLEPRRVEVKPGEDKKLLLAVATYSFEGRIGFKAELIYPPFHRMLHSLPKGIMISFDPPALVTHHQSMTRVTVGVKADKSVKPGKYTICVRTVPLHPPFGDKSFVLAVAGEGS
ncbi:MAG TPA: hypothetical protein HA348_03780 [Thermoplasmata archaeon]|nr:hypothetical protein [Thermoplasmata archaeon]